MNDFVLKKDTVELVLNYLTKQPWKDVYHIIGKIDVDVKNQPKQEEETLNIPNA